MMFLQEVRLNHKLRSYLCLLFILLHLVLIVVPHSEYFKYLIYHIIRIISIGLLSFFISFLTVLSADDSGDLLADLGWNDLHDLLTLLVGDNLTLLSLKT